VIFPDKYSGTRIIFLFPAFVILRCAYVLKGAADYARAHNLVFTAIDLTDIHTRAATVFKDNDNESCPVVIYMPWTKDEQLWNAKKQETEFSSFGPYLESFDPQKCLDECCSTFNFEYSELNAQQVCALSEFNLLATKDILIGELEKVV